MKASRKKTKNPTAVKQSPPTTQPSDGLSNRSSEYLYGGVLLLVTALAYFPAWSAGLIIDDLKFVIEDPIMTARDGLLRIWFNPLENNGVWPYLPVTRSSFWIERQLFGANLSVMHGVNILLHATSAILLWLGMRHFKLRGAWLAGLLLAVHPVYVQSVVWVAQRKNLLAGLFFLIALWSYLHFIRKQENRWYAVSLLAFAAALLSKTSVIMLPILLLLGHWWMRIALKSSDWVRLIPFFAMSLIAGLARIWFEDQSFGVSEVDSILAIPERVLLVAHVPLFYLQKFLMPYPLMFNYPQWAMDISQWSQYLPWLSWGVVLGFLYWGSHRWGRGLIFASAGFLILLFPVIGIFENSWHQFSYVSDHWVHLPGFLIMALLANGLVQASDRLPRWAPVLVSLPLIWLTWNQAQTYQDPVHFYEHLLTQNPKAWMAYNNLGNHYLKHNQNHKAYQIFDDELQARPSAEAYMNRGISSYRQKRYEKAIDDFNKALALEPDFAEVYNNRAIAYQFMEKYDKALADVDQALQLNPEYAGAYITKGLVYRKQAQIDLALQAYNRAIEIDPQEPEAYNNRGIIHHSNQRYSQAVEDYSMALQLRPYNARYFTNRGLSLLKLQKTHQALADLQNACQLGSCELWNKVQQQLK